MWVQGRRGGKAETEVLGLSNDDGGFPGGSGVKNLPTHVGDVGLIPELGRFPWKRKWQPLQYSCLENLMDRGAWWDTVCGISRVRHGLVTKPPPSFNNSPLHSVRLEMRGIKIVFWEIYTFKNEKLTEKHYLLNYNKTKKNGTFHLAAESRKVLFWLKT